MGVLSQQLTDLGFNVTVPQVDLRLGELNLPFSTNDSDAALRRLPARYYPLTRDGLTASAFVRTLREIIAERKSVPARQRVPMVRDTVYGLCQLAHRQRDSHQGPEWLAWQQLVMRFLRMKRCVPLDREADTSALIESFLRTF